MHREILLRAAREIEERATPRRVWEIALAVLVLLLQTVCAHAQGVAATLPRYTPQEQVSGVIRIWGHGSRGHDYVGGLVNAWEAAFRKYQPNVRFENSLLGNASAIGGVYTGAADLALMGREIWPTEADGYQQARGHKPFSVSVMTGSVDVRDHAFALVAFVNRQNPLSKITLAQLDGIFGADHRRGSRNLRTWGDLGLGGEWADKPIHVYGYEIRRDFAQFFEQTALAGSEKWNCDLRQLADVRGDGGASADAGQAILDAVARDQYGVAISSLAYEANASKPLALAADANSPYYTATRQTVAVRQYPLTRVISIFFDRAPGTPVDPKLKEFLSFVLSAEGQAAVAADGGYLPLTPNLAAAERGKLE